MVIRLNSQVPVRCFHVSMVLQCTKQRQVKDQDDLTIPMYPPRKDDLQLLTTMMLEMLISFSFEGSGLNTSINLDHPTKQRSNDPSRILSLNVEGQKVLEQVFRIATLVHTQIHFRKKRKMIKIDL